MSITTTVWRAGVVTAAAAVAAVSLLPSAVGREHPCSR